MSIIVCKPFIDLSIHIRYDDGSYFPSGMPNRDERREDEWTDLQEDLLQPIDNVVEEKTTEFPDLLDPVPRETTNNPVFEPFMPQQPQVRGIMASEKNY